MTKLDYTEVQLLQSALELIELQNQEIERLRELTLGNSETNKDHMTQVHDAQKKALKLVSLLHESDKGISDALLVLDSLKGNLSRIEEAATRALLKFSDIGFTGQITGEIKVLSNAVSDATDIEFMKAHEQYLRYLKNRINQAI